MTKTFKVEEQLERGGRKGGVVIKGQGVESLSG
jgi:hypothetical protein